jgi:Ca2+-binding EF-hand superfamily protein
MNRPRPPKKTETLEVRLPHAVKQAFMARTRAQGRTASAVLREFVDSYLADAAEARPMTVKRYLKPVAATAVAASALALYALTPSAVAAAPDLRAVFAQLDRDHDGAISAAEFVDRRDTGAVLFRRQGADAPHDEPARPFMLPLRPDAPVAVAGGDFAAMLRHDFAAQDGDGNGAVTFGEFESYHLAMYRQGFAAIDLDRDGAIERPEYAVAVRRAPGWPAPAILPFQDADDNADGRITWREFFGRVGPHAAETEPSPLRAGVSHMASPSFARHPELVSGPIMPRSWSYRAGRMPRARLTLSASSALEPRAPRRRLNGP